MKVESISIQRFKLFEEFELAFKNKTLQEVSNRFLVLGDNGTGKTTLLQAIALPLALATRSIQSVSDFDWMGFLAGRFWKWGAPKIELDVSFTTEEIEATQHVAKQWYDAQPEEFKSRHQFIEPAAKRFIHLLLSGEHWIVGNDTAEERAQFQGRFYAQGLLKTDHAAVRSQFPKLPGVFWFDQFRNLVSSPSVEGNGEGLRESNRRMTFEVGVGRLRQFLIGWKQKQESGRLYEKDFLQELGNLYRKVFPERTFLGVESGQTSEELYFVLNDGQHTYDIVEMSAGEQSLFPILYKLVRQQVAYSVVLIDEIDLNLHPPAAQSFVSQLHKMAPHCQYIMTTHSEAVSDVIGNEETFRLQGGALCL